MSNSIDTGSPLGEDFYSFQNEDKEICSKVNSKLKAANKVNIKRKAKKNDADDSVSYFKNTGSEPDK